MAKRRTEREIMEQTLMKRLSGRSKSITSALQHMERTGQMLNDYLVPRKKLEFVNNGAVKVAFNGEEYGLHKNAITQLAGRMGVSSRDLQREALGRKWERQVFVDRMNAYKSNLDSKNMLVREVDGKVKAMLSDKYRRLNTAEIFISFLQAASAAGSVLVDATNGDLRNFMEVVHPAVVEIPTEKNGTVYSAFGAQIRNSDFGLSKLELRIYQMNVVCLNGMVSKAMISDVHLGRKLESLNGVTFAQDTMSADTTATALAVRDIMGSVYSPENLKRERERIIEASEVELDFKQEIKQLPKMGMQSGEVELLERTLMENDPKDGVQGKNTLWKLAQGMTAVANKVKDGERKHDLQDLASSLMANYVK